MSSTAETDAEDVNDFLKRIQELGIKRDQEDEERNKRLEEEILQGRKERQARRAERARSISPIKDSPANTPPPYKPSASETCTQLPLATFTPSQELQRPPQSLNRELLVDETMGRLTGEDSPAKHNGLSAIDRSYDNLEMKPSQSNSIKASPSSAMPSRSPTLSWQRRPNSQTSDRSKTRPFPIAAGEIAARSPRETTKPSAEETTPKGRDEIAHSLASKDPAWFRQTSDRGISSAAYRKTQVEDKDADEATPTMSRIGLPGMSRTQKEYTGSPDVKETKLSDIGRTFSASASASTSSSSEGSTILGSTDKARPDRSEFVSPMPATSSQRFAQPGSTSSLSDGNTDQSNSTRSLAMSPSQGRISPERLDRPISPTKGMGGFVQSAMMKRSDSVSKRWSVQSPGGLTRGNSVASNRSSQDLTSRTPLGNILNSTTREPRPSSLSRENTPLSMSRPSSSQSNALVGLDDDHPGMSGALWGSVSGVNLDGDFVKPGIPASQLQVPLDADCSRKIDRQESLTSIETPKSPTKPVDSRRWSPTKASWLESALNKPESPKPKQAAPPPQPSWMSEISKAKQKVPGAETANRSPTHKHQVSIGGLLRSPPMGGIAKPLTIGGLPTGFSSSTIPTGRANKTSDANPETKISSGNVSDNTPVKDLETGDNKTAETSKPTMAPIIKSSSLAISKVKPETPPKKDFKANPISNQPLSPNIKTEEPEFKNVFGQLRRTKTQNYVAPDELKDNILRGKAGLNVTGGPKKTERRDEFKEAILKKKEDFKKSQLEGTGITKTKSAPLTTDLPEALLKKATLGRANTSTAVSGARGSDVSGGDLSDSLSRNNLPSNSTKPKASPDANAPAKPQTKFELGNNLAGRFNPALAGILARGPPPKPTALSTNAGFTVEVSSRPITFQKAERRDSGPQLTHMTKGRARGPRRKAPSAVTRPEPTAESTA